MQDIVIVTKLTSGQFLKVLAQPKLGHSIFRDIHSSSKFKTFLLKVALPGVIEAAVSILFKIFRKFIL